MVLGTMNSETRLIAMLVDGDNAQPSLIGHVLAETAKYGVVTTRRIYGDWTSPQMNGWKQSLHESAVQPVQQFRFTTGKNATDSALIIDAMDILHTGAVGGFCIVSSDSDYTRLATRIREQGLFVMGVGRSITPKSFVNACEVFVYTENLAPPQEYDEQDGGALQLSDWTEIASRAIEMSVQDDGWAFLGAVGNSLRQLDPAFDSRSYGHKQLSQLIGSRPDRFTMGDNNPNGGPSVVRVRLNSWQNLEDADQG